MSKLESLSNEELGALVAERVMGWHKDQVASGYFYWESTDGPTPYRVIRSDHKTHPLPDVWSPATSIADAWEVVEKILSEEGRWFFQIQNCHAEEGSEFCVFFMENDEDGKDAEGMGPLPRAICLAALKAVGVDD